MGRYVFQPDHHPKLGPGVRVINMLQYQFPDPEGYRVIWPKERALAAFTPPTWWKPAKR